MKIFGIICVVFGVLNFIVFIFAGSSVGAELAGRKLGGAMMLLALGAFLIYRAKQKAKEKEDKDKWLQS